MIVTILDPLVEPLQDQLLGGNVLYRPDLRWKQPSILVKALVKHRVYAILTRTELPLESMLIWVAARSRTYRIYVFVGSSAESAARPKDDGPEEHLVLHVYGNSETSAYVSAFELLEREYTRHTF